MARATDDTLPARRDGLGGSAPFASRVHLPVWRSVHANTTVKPARTAHRRAGVPLDSNDCVLRTVNPHVFAGLPPRKEIWRRSTNVKKRWTHSKSPWAGPLR